MTELVFRNTSEPLVVLDADVLGRRRTGDETYVASLLAALPAVAPDLRFAAVTRRPDLVPDGIEAIELPATIQEVRMAWSLPRLLARLRPALAHFQHALPLRLSAPAVVTIHDLSFERDAAAMPRKDRIVFKLFVPRAAERAAKILTVSERTRRDLVDLYGVPRERIVVTPNGVDGVFRPGDDPGARDYVLFVGAIQPRKDPLAALRAADAVGLPLVVVGPTKDAALARELERGGAQLRGYVAQEELAQLYRDAACFVFPSRYEGFGLPVVEAMASGTPVVATPDPAVVEVAGDAAVYADGDGLANAIRRAIGDRDRLAAAGVERARQFTWEHTARLTADVYREVIGA